MENRDLIILSPNSLNLFLECKRCFWLEKKQGIRRPSLYPYALNSAVDILLKQEFDKYRAERETHPLLVANNIPAKLFKNQKLLNKWRDNFQGIRYYNKDLNATFFGAIDDILEFKDGKLAPLGYKSTDSSIAKIYDRFQLQMDAYTYLLEKNDYSTPRKGCLVFYIVDKENKFEDKLPFRKEAYVIDTNPLYIEKLFEEAVETLRKNIPPMPNKDCKFCEWFEKTSNY
jgi:CRISPR/Cas system-associated exonuclease Cas4 (RecB family)